jgi:hypothetical protein
MDPFRAWRRTRAGRVVMPFDKYVKRPALPLCYLGEHPGNRDSLLTFVDAISDTARDQVSGRAIFNLFSTFASWVA